MLSFKKFMPFIFLIFIFSQPLKAQVTPEFQLATRGVMSFNVDHQQSLTTNAVNDFSDSGLLTGFRQKLYNRFRGQMVFGFQFPDAESDLGQIFFHQVFLLLEDKSNIIKLGRSRVQSALIEFPTLRDDDAIFLTDVLNPFSSGDDTEDNQYGNVFELSHIWAQRVWLTVHGEHYRKTPLSTVEETDFKLNGIGFSLQYRVPETQLWNRPFLNQIGIGFNNFFSDRPGYSNDFEQAVKNILFSTVLNLRPDPVHFWDFRFQSVYNIGFQEIQFLSDWADFTRARSFAAFGSLRYLNRKLERPNVQLALSFGVKTFPELINSSGQWQVVANTFYRLGENYDVGLQFQYTKFKGDLQTLFGKSETRLQFALVFSIDQLWNSQFDDRESLLNLEHGYIK